MTAVSDPVADTPLVTEVRCTTYVRGGEGVLLAVHATTPLATRAIATPPHAVRRIAWLCHRFVTAPGVRCLDMRTLLPMVRRCGELADPIPNDAGLPFSSNLRRGT